MPQQRYKVIYYKSPNTHNKRYIIDVQNMSEIVLNGRLAIDYCIYFSNTNIYQMYTDDGDYKKFKDTFVFGLPKELIHP